MKKTLIVGALALLTTLSFAASTNCPQFYLEGDAPSIENQKLAPKTKELCFEAYGVMHSGLSKTPLWSAEYLTRENLNQNPRVKTFSTKKAVCLRVRERNLVIMLTVATTEGI